MRKLHILSFFLIFILCNPIFGDIERRMAVDVGSGGTKVAIADVETETNQIVQVVLDTSYPVPYQASLDKSKDGTFDPETQEIGLKTFKAIKNLSEEHGVAKIVAVATSAFRKANNCKEYLAAVHNATGIQIRVIPQREEGEIAFFSALASDAYNPEDVVVWDIGTGSLQMTTKNASGGLTVYMGEQMGSVPFKSYIIDTIQDKDSGDVNTPNPIAEDEVKLADSYARAFARKAYPLIKEKINNQVNIVGIGRLFYHSIRPLVFGK